jgi:type IV pilus assembly protein PilO
MTLDDLKNLDPENIGEWPAPVKIALVLIVMAAIIFAGWHFDIQNLRVTIENEQRKEVEQIASLESKQRQAANLEALKVQMQEMQQSFGDMLRQLPNKTEVAGLLIDISQTGLAAGLEFELFKPAKEKPSEFYAELPIQITVVGDYHRFGEFISGIAALPRIVTTHDINIQKKGDTDTLVLQAVAKTYRALDEEEANQ